MQRLHRAKTMMHEKLSEKEQWEQGQQSLRQRWATACVGLGALAIVSIELSDRPFIEVPLKPVAALLARVFRYDIDVPFVLVGMAVVWFGLAIAFYGRCDEERARLQAQSAREEKQRQSQEFEAARAQVERFASGQRPHDLSATPQVLDEPQG